MKKFSEPEVLVEELDIADVITASSCQDDVCWEDCPTDGFTCKQEV